MKIPLRIRSLALGIVCLVTINAHAFFDPAIGRWASRDPIGESGGNALFGFVNNDPINQFDELGLIGMGETKMHCCHLIWNERTHCCCRGYLVSRAAADTGIRIERWDGLQPVAGRGFPYHVWLTWKGGSVDINAISDMFLISSPAAGDSLFGTTPKRTTTKVMLSKCDYDFEKLNSCLGRKAAAAKGTIRVGLKCDDFAADVLSACKEESKGCTSK